MSANPDLIRIAKDLRLKKGLSQNFLVDETYITRIQAAAELGDSSMPLVEIGPGSGFLTEKLLALGHPVTAIEVDSKMVRYLEAQYGQHPRFSVIHQDVRQVDLMPLLHPHGVVVGNLPYHLTGPILFQLIGELDDAQYPLRGVMDKVILMVQKEVGDRLIAQPGDTDYGQLSLQAQFWFTITPVTLVPARAFYPSPKVDSMVVQLIPRRVPAIDASNLKALARLIKIAFTHRRKTVLNNFKIAQLGSVESLQQAMVQAGIPLESRPQELSIASFGALCDALYPSS